jgi:cyclophilin family peptidyl-prolyl cis-trans isomerase
MKRTAVTIVLVLIPLVCAAAVLPAASQHPRVRIVTTAGAIVVELDPKRAPKTAANFLHLVDTKFYNGGTFFRAIPKFVIQGGNKQREAPTDSTIKLEDPKDTGVKNVDGAIAMARTTDPDSASSEFFIDDGAQPSLDAPPGQPGYAAFGHVVSGMSVVRAIARLPVNGDQLITPVQIIRMERVH